MNFQIKMILNSYKTIVLSILRSFYELPWNAVTVEGETAEFGWGLDNVVIIDGVETDSAGVTWLIVDPVAWRPFNAWTCWIAWII